MIPVLDEVHETAHGDRVNPGQSVLNKERMDTNITFYDACPIDTTQTRSAFRRTLCTIFGNSVTNSGDYLVEIIAFKLGAGLVQGHPVLALYDGTPPAPE